MRLLPALILLSLVGCMSRPGMVDCTTNRAYPAFSKPLCGGPPFDPFVWVTGDCNCCCAGAMKCAYTPYGGRTCFGEDMKYVPGCTAPPLRWSPPAMPSPPGGHTVRLPADCPPPLSPKPSSSTTAKPTAPPSVPAPPAPPAETGPADGAVKPPASGVEPSPDADSAADQAEWLKPKIIRDARHERLDQSRF